MAAWAAEILICAKDSPFDTGCKVGDILVVRPDGFTWGLAEVLPDYIVIKIPGVTYEAAKMYEDQLTADDGVDPQGNPKTKMVRLRKYAVPLAYMQNAISKNWSVVVITVQQKKLDFINGIVTKTQ